ncbi:cysteine desulfurase [Candidatus Gracilibacteria bacterium]|nr:cysteine desulfurase [Candidatus Gracilibacteria bacterium]
MTKFLYFDHAATTPVDPAVLEAMLPYYTEKFGNPSSIYQLGQEARRAVEASRETVAVLLDVTPREVIFTSGGTEANNLILFGAAAVYEKLGKHIITSKIEHDSVLKPIEELERRGFEVTYLDVGEDGIVKPDDVRAALRPDTILVSLMYANNEIGTIQPIREIAWIISEHKKKHFKLTSSTFPLPIFHTDACQASAYLSLSIKELGVDAMTINSGKIYGPKGSGALYLKEGASVLPQQYGGGQEHRHRSGTENVPAIVGFAKALELVQLRRDNETKRLLPLRDELIDGILKTIPESRLNGHATRRLPNNVNVSFKGLEGETILMRLDMAGIAASSGSACTSGSLEPSHVIRALGLTDEWTHSSTRFTLGHENTQDQVKHVLEVLPPLIKELREFSPFS